MVQITPNLLKSQLSNVLGEPLQEKETPRHLDDCDFRKLKKKNSTTETTRLKTLKNADRDIKNNVIFLKYLFQDQSYIRELELEKTTTFKLEAGVKYFTRLTFPAQQQNFRFRHLLCHFTYSEKKPVHVYGFKDEKDLFNENKGWFYGNRPHFKRMLLDDVLEKDEETCYFIVFYAAGGDERVTIETTLNWKSEVQKKAEWKRVKELEAKQ
jgi:hypothetical protein